jgi:hypothetical protein
MGILLAATNLLLPRQPFSYTDVLDLMRRMTVREQSRTVSRPLCVSIVEHGCCKREFACNISRQALGSTVCVVLLRLLALGAQKHEGERCDIRRLQRRHRGAFISCFSTLNTVYTSKRGCPNTTRNYLCINISNVNITQPEPSRPAVQIACNQTDP